MRPTTSGAVPTAPLSGQSAHVFVEQPPAGKLHGLSRFALGWFIAMFFQATLVMTGVAVNVLFQTGSVCVIV